MTYDIFISRQAEVEIADAYGWLAQQTALHAPRWHDGLLDAILTLETSPERCPVYHDPENPEAKLRQMLYGNRRHAYRIVFTIQARRVNVLHVRHAAQQ
jgi:plasmid stabilization system protein ParE